MPDTGPETDALAALVAAGDPSKAVEMAAYHKAPRRTSGSAIPASTRLGVARVAPRVRVAAPRRARGARSGRATSTRRASPPRSGPRRRGSPTRRPRSGAKSCSWVPDFDAWAIADHACKAWSAGSTARPRSGSTSSRAGPGLSEPLGPAGGAGGDAALGQAHDHPTPPELAARERILGWAAGYVAGPRLVRAEGGRMVAPHALRSRSRSGSARSSTAGGHWVKPFACGEALRQLRDETGFG